MVYRTWVSRILALAFLIGSFGCGSSGKPVKVAGTVTLDGAPLEGVTVMFIPAKEGRQATGITDSDGKFELTTIKSHDGALPGEYKVTVMAPREGGGSGNISDPNSKEAKEMFAKLLNESREGKPREAMEAKQTVHPNYTRPEKTPLKEKVPSDGALEIKLRKNGT